MPEKWQIAVMLWLSAMMLACPAFPADPNPYLPQLDLTPTLSVAHTRTIRAQVNQNGRPERQKSAQRGISISPAYEASGSNFVTDHYSHQPVHFACDRKGQCRDLSE